MAKKEKEPLKITSENTESNKIEFVEPEPSKPDLSDLKKAEEKAKKRGRRSKAELELEKMQVEMKALSSELFAIGLVTGLDMFTPGGVVCSDERIKGLTMSIKALQIKYGSWLDKYGPEFAFASSIAAIYMDTFKARKAEKVKGEKPKEMTFDEVVRYNNEKI